jgi:uncharacterized protein (DUF2141 family)
VPPTAVLTQPADMAMFAAGQPIPVTVTASDHDGQVQRVEIWVQEADFFMSPKTLAASLTKAPFTFSIRDLPPGHYMLWAVAIDDGGESSQSLAIHVMVH